ncbi:unnamed protein product [Closterium sp. NIES-64]|nr:unnamed protein product [Closterium sp. NIES-64]CAI6010389.1 unnamed protein product [Closterium sp. NIES-65]
MEAHISALEGHLEQTRRKLEETRKGLEEGERMRAGDLKGRVEDNEGEVMNVARELVAVVQEELGGMVAIKGELVEVKGELVTVKGQVVEQDCLQEVEKEGKDGMRTNEDVDWVSVAVDGQVAAVEQCQVPTHADPDVLEEEMDIEEAIRAIFNEEMDVSQQAG